ncbi:hypothetical protein [Ramlibacter rhizophilus]|uniref:Uncharacterized protein n=1 Tax=Ramlibacter rhizophilus TaxID=1781167 RepID=A0A4Z0BDJ8_9BURK|nr:hypothetical protein [Ramlibacter rhizophilus]TFY96751.1 hypothetical protein EZ242_18885 [Ramlibacter rhizophilus]
MTLGEHHGGPALPDARFEGRVQFQQLVRDALACAAREGWRQIILSDADFLDWPLGERELAESLMAWSRQGRRITLLARRWDEATRQHARFVAWRKTWSDIIEARACRNADPLEIPSAIWAPGWMMQRQDLQRWAGLASHDTARRHLLHEELQGWLAKSTTAFPASTLGL